MKSYGITIFHSNETSLAELLHTAIYFLYFNKRKLKLFAKVFFGGYLKLKR